MLNVSKNAFVYKCIVNISHWYSEFVDWVSQSIQSLQVLESFRDHKDIT